MPQEPVGSNAYEPETPYLALDLHIMERNLSRAADDAAAKGIVLRPHAKTHKMPEIARRQLAHGAIGISLATVSEAEIFADAGIDDIFIAYPVWPSAARVARIRELASRITLRLGVDSVESAELLGAALPGSAVQVLIEVDSGHHRSGARPEDAGSVAMAATRAGLRVGGVFTFPGHSYGGSISGGGINVGASVQAALDESTAIRTAVESFSRVGIHADIRSGGSTPSLPSLDGSVLTEGRPGVYVFNDAQQVEMGICTFEDVALTVATTVVSKHGRDVVVDAGSKVLGADRPAWTTGFGRVAELPEARIMALSEHHATVHLPDDATMPELGSRLSIIPNHVCNAVNLADTVFVVQNGVMTESWAVAARGANT